MNLPDVYEEGMHILHTHLPVFLTASLKCPHTNTHSMGNRKNRDLWQFHSHDLVAVTETWEDSFHDWNAVMDILCTFRKEKPESEMLDLLFLRESSWSVLNSAKGRMKNKQRAYG